MRPPAEMRHIKAELWPAGRVGRILCVCFALLFPMSLFSTPVLQWWQKTRFGSWVKGSTTVTFAETPWMYLGNTNLLQIPVISTSLPFHCCFIWASLSYLKLRAELEALHNHQVTADASSRHRARRKQLNCPGCGRPALIPLHSFLHLRLLW